MNTLLCLIFLSYPSFKCDVIITPPPGKYELHAQHDHREQRRSRQRSDDKRVLYRPRRAAK